MGKQTLRVNPAGRTGGALVGTRTKTEVVGGVGTTRARLGSSITQADDVEMLGKPGRP
jgi:hypothetical protein